jgi:hypothetical protein
MALIICRIASVGDLPDVKTASTRGQANQNPGCIQRKPHSARQKKTLDTSLSKPQRTNRNCKHAIKARQHRDTNNDGNDDEEKVMVIKR